VPDSDSRQVTLVNTRSRRALCPITVGRYPGAMAIVA
jgi:hypothetical protein